MFFFSSRRRHTRLQGDWSSDVCSSDLQRVRQARAPGDIEGTATRIGVGHGQIELGTGIAAHDAVDRKSTRLNSSHLVISYAVFCLKKKKTTNIQTNHTADTSLAM